MKLAFTVLMAIRLIGATMPKCEVQRQLNEPVVRPCAERIKEKFLRYCSAGECARMSIDAITDSDCMIIPAKDREEFTRQ